MNGNHRLRRSNSGFTLAELAVVLVIVALLLGGLLSPLSAQIDVRNTSETRKALAETREALMGFAAAKGRLPCPARATTASGAAGAGEEVRIAGKCASESGVLPWVTLGVAETDAWGRRYTYRVTPDFARDVQPPQTPQNAAFALSTVGTLEVRSSAAAGAAAVATEVPAVIVSHGPNGQGAFTTDGTQLPGGEVDDELDNQLNGGGASMANARFVSRTRAPNFDDEVAWISTGVLFNRMITAGKLP